jgi:hypothetical protein
MRIITGLCRMVYEPFDSLFSESRLAMVLPSKPVAPQFDVRRPMLDVGCSMFKVQGSRFNGAVRTSVTLVGQYIGNTIVVRGYIFGFL